MSPTTWRSSSSGQPRTDRPSRLDHVALTVADRERSARFYAEHFGLTDRVHDDEHLLVLGSPTGGLLALSEGDAAPGPAAHDTLRLSGGWTRFRTCGPSGVSRGRGRGGRVAGVRPDAGAGLRPRRLPGRDLRLLVAHQPVLTGNSSPLDRAQPVIPAAKTERCEDAGRLNGGSTGPTEDDALNTVSTWGGRRPAQRQPEPGGRRLIRHGASGGRCANVCGSGPPRCARPCRARAMPPMRRRQPHRRSAPHRR